MKFQASAAVAALALAPSVLAAPALEARACVGPAVNDATVDLVKSFESLVKNPEPDPVGLPTVGYGHLCQKKNCAEVKYKFPLSEKTASKLLQDDLKRFQNGITGMTAEKVTLNANEYGALVSWAFNVGNGAAEGSSLIKRLNKGEKASEVLPEELPKWKMGGGKPLPGLVRRRKAEIKLSKKDTKDKALPADTC